MKRETKVKCGKRKVFIFTVIFAMWISVSIVFASATITVCHSGCDYTSIQAAIDAAKTGDIIEVHSGTYYENVDVNKQLTLRGVDTGTDKPVVDAGGDGDVIKVSIDGCTIKGFTSTGCGTFGAGIMVISNNNIFTDINASNNTNGIYLLSSSNNTITGNNVSNNNGWSGICLYSSSNNTITGNTASNNIYGFYLLSSSNNTITGNTASNNKDHGIFIYSSSNNNTVTGNNANSNNNGIIVYYSCSNIITGNNASNNSYSYGIYLRYSCNNTITGNNASNNKDHGILLYHSRSNTITGNNAGSNNDYGILLYNSSNNNIYLNNFINKSGNAVSSYSNNIWNSTTQITYTYNGNTNTNYLGNYWGDYKEKYPDANEMYDCGIWDTSYSIDGDNDTYPLMQPWENYFSPTEQYTKTDVGATSNITPSSPSDLAAYLPPEYKDTDISDSVVLNVNVTDITPDTTDAAYSDVTINIGELDIETCKVFKTGMGFLPEVEDVTTLPTVSGEPAFSRDLVNKTVTVRLYVGDPLLGVIPAAVEAVFDTGEGTYPSIMGTHNGTIIPSRDITVYKMYTYPCAGTGGHSESIKLYKNETLIASGVWNGYEGDWHNITIDNETGVSYVTLLKGHEYNYTIVTGSYPQIIHESSKEVTGGTITCSSFEDANGKVYYDWIPAIKME